MIGHRKLDSVIGVDQNTGMFQRPLHRILLLMGVVQKCQMEASRISIV